MWVSARELRAEHAFWVFGFPFLVLMPVFARDVLRVGAAGYGVLTASVGLGAVAGALGVAVLSRRIRKGLPWVTPSFRGSSRTG